MYSRVYEEDLTDDEGPMGQDSTTSSNWSLSTNYPGVGNRFVFNFGAILSVETSFRKARKQL